MINLQTITTSRSKLTVIEKLPFDIKRIYYLYDIDPNVKREGHAHKDLRRLMVVLKGFVAFSIDGYKNNLSSNPTIGILIEPLQWLEFGYISDDAIVMMVASKEHDESDCIRDKEELHKLKSDYSNL